jgi:hypothetical protein
MMLNRCWFMQRVASVKVAAAKRTSGIYIPHHRNLESLFIINLLIYAESISSEYNVDINMAHILNACSKLVPTENCTAIHQYMVVGLRLAPAI